ncbi:MAG TPA: DUF1802 family protein [Abditibacteriaceae bacterium]
MINTALKEWAATCLALARGEQIVILRKGGLRDDEGTFALESPAFWLQPTYFHHAEHLVKPEFQSVLQEAERRQESGENDRFIRLQLWARVEKVWSVAPQNDAALANIPHIWSEAYLDVRRAFRPDTPILCAALRVYSASTSHIVPMQPQFLGCRSWLDLPRSLPTENSIAVLDDTAFAKRIGEITEILG